ncbi:hypothetical protein S40285_07393 [Stachybotrys chlorohalonatus IBT 40285]|uniref:Uncharacterized protein n=1 Tax=Stachybotrys chlorohalonatus (strain IBT 40285) TaxID=1283841 RepID=A0A084Q8K4_STAC4|nr:hypothetical protein S40285_07393 [Stachybotrys chlorohalonata IBT 40285]
MAAQLLTLSSVYYGRDGGMPYLREGIHMAQRLKLFGVPDSITSPAVNQEPQDEWLRMLSCTAWSFFNLATMRSLQFQEEDLSIKYPPSLPIPRLWIKDRHYNEAPSNYANDVFEASLCQLKHMVRVFDCKYQSSSYGILWHSALLHVANAMLMVPDDPESLSYFMLCISCYRDLSPSYRVAYAIAKGLLAIAWEKGLISSSKAKLTLAQFQIANRTSVTLDNIRATFVVDLSAALINTKESQVEALAQRFDAIAVFDDLTVGTDYLQSPPHDLPGRPN